MALDVDAAKSALENEGFKVVGHERLPNDTGSQLHINNGAIVNVFDTGTWNVQGKRREPVEDILDHADSGAGGAASVPAPSRNVFVVYGHDETAKTELEAMLRRWGLTPFMMDQLPSEGQTIIEKLEKYTAEDVVYGVVLATPDDRGYPADSPDEERYRARQNVVLELGMLLSKLGRKRVAILLKDQAEMERPSDIQGLIYIPFSDSVTEARLPLAKEMKEQGIDIELRDL